MDPGYKFPKTGGRKKGTPNKKITSLKELIAKYEKSPEVLMLEIINNTLACGVCRGKKRTPYILPATPMQKCPNCKHVAEGSKKFIVCPNCKYEPEIRTALRKCMSCLGTTRENCNPSLRGAMAAELMGYIYAKRKAIEVSAGEDEDGDKIPLTVHVNFVKPAPAAES
jgi:ribosomal protein L32